MQTAKEAAVASKDNKKAFREELADILIAISVITKQIALRLISVEESNEVKEEE